MLFSDAVKKMNCDIIKVFGSAWHHYPRKSSDDVDYPTLSDETRTSQDFCGVFKNPERSFLTQDARNNHIEAQGNMAYLEVASCDDIVFKQYDCVKSCADDTIYEISNIKRFDNGMIRLILKIGGDIS